jgi:DNA-binding GntR family transcriptional regulator
LLPNEVDLATSLGVSRQTVRQAIDQLRQVKLVSARRGVGTRVEARHASAGYQFSLQTLSDIFQYATDTEFELVERGLEAVEGKLAASFGLRPGRRLFRLTGLRRFIGDAQPLCWAHVWVDARHASVVSEIDVFRSAIFSLLEEKTGESIVTVSQDIEAVQIPEELAARLGTTAGTPGLQVTRRYFGEGHRFVEGSVSLYPADRFSYRIDVRRIRPSLSHAE